MFHLHKSKQVLLEKQLQSLVKTCKEIRVPLKTTAKFPLISTGTGFRSDFSRWAQRLSYIFCWLITSGTDLILLWQIYFWWREEEVRFSATARRGLQAVMGLLVFSSWWIHSSGFYLFLYYSFSWLPWQRQNFPLLPYYFFSIGEVIPHRRSPSLWLGTH